MGLVTGTTQHRLDLVKSYDPINPYIVGFNGVTSVTYDGNGDLEFVKYTIDTIDYITTMNIKYPVVDGVSVIPINVEGTATKSHKPTRFTMGKTNKVKQVKLKSSISEPSNPPSRNYPTTFSYVTQLIGETSYFVFKGEEKMGVVFSPKVHEEIFIERQSITIFEQQARLSEIDTLDRLVEYKDGFYNVTNLE